MELRRGTLVLAVLLALREEEYGYSLRKKLLKVGLEIEESTLYPLIRRLESQELLNSRWDESGEGRKRRYYQISPVGQQLLTELLTELDTIQTSLNTLNKS